MFAGIFIDISWRCLKNLIWTIIKNPTFPVRLFISENPNWIFIIKNNIKIKLQVYIFYCLLFFEYFLAGKPRHDQIKKLKYWNLLPANLANITLYRMEKKFLHRSLLTILENSEILVEKNRKLIKIWNFD